MTTSPKYQPSPPNRLCELGWLLTTQYVMTRHQENARPQDPATLADQGNGEIPDSKTPFSQAKGSTKPKIGRSALSCLPEVASRGMSKHSPTPRKLLPRIGIALVVPLAIWCAVYTAPINTNPIPAPCAGPCLIGYVLPPTTPAPAASDWIGALHDTLQTRERNKAAGRQAGAASATGSRCRP